MARAMAMRWRCPPENSCGYLYICSGLSPTRSMSAATASTRLLRGSGVRWPSASTRVEKMLKRGLREAYGSWNTIWKSSRRRRISRGGRVVSSVPSSTMRPEVTGCSCIMARERVDLPQPLSPTSPRILPRGIESNTSSTARTSSPVVPQVFRTGKCTLTCSSSRYAICAHCNKSGMRKQFSIESCELRA